MTTRLRDQGGFSLVEVLVAMAISMVAITAVFSLTTNGSRNSLAQQRQASLQQIATEQLEQTRTVVTRYGFAALALSSAPSPGGTLVENPTDPTTLLTSASGVTSLRIPNDYHATSAGILATEPLVIGTVGVPGQVNPGPTTVTSGKTTATVYRFVSARAGDCSVGVTVAAPYGSCGYDTRRVTVAVVPTRLAGLSQDQNAVVYLSTVLANSVPSAQANGGGGIELGINLG